MVSDEIGFNDAELRVLALLGDEKGHAQWEICSELKIDKAYASKTLKGLKNRGLIFREDRDLDRPGRRGPHTEYPYYIQKDQLQLIVDTFLYQIRRYLRESKVAHSKRKMLKANCTLTPSSEKRLVSKKLWYIAKANTLMHIFEIPLYRDCTSKTYGIDCISCEGIHGVLYSEVGLLRDAEQKVRSPEDFYREYLSKIEHAKKIEAERRKLEADPVAMQKIKELWAKDEIAGVLKSLGYSQDVIIAQINQMLNLRELSPQNPCPRPNEKTWHPE